jgi:predicted NBD/HSP70 family sugar kinase
VSTASGSRALGPGVGELFQLFRDGRPRTKAELADVTGLARSTISLRTDALVHSGLLRRAGEAVSSGGRPPSMLVFEPTARVVAGCDLGADHARVVLADLNGRILASAETELEIASGPRSVLGWVQSTVLSLLGEQGIPVERVAGLGIGLPGPVEHATGRPVKPPLMPGWDGFDVVRYFEGVFPAPVLVDNDVNLLALGERAGAFARVPDLVFVKVSTGIGAGIVSGGMLQRGAQGAAGDIGHVVPPRSAGTGRPLDDERDLEALASGPAIAEALLAEGLVQAATTGELVRLLIAGDRRATALTRQAGREIGAVLSTVVSVLNPSVILVGGRIARAGEDLLAGIREAVYRRSVPLATQRLQILQSTGGEYAGAVGAASMIIERVLSVASVDRLASVAGPQTTDIGPGSIAARA